jgi:hypothetical protein
MGHSMPLARSERAVAELDGKVWVLGGYPPGRLPSNLIQVYDPAASRWSLGPRLPQPIHHMMVAAVGGKLYRSVVKSTVRAPGGRRCTWPIPGVHDPAIGGWAERAPIPIARSGGGKAVIDGKTYVAGGRRLGALPSRFMIPPQTSGRSSQI